MKHVQTLEFNGYQDFSNYLTLVLAAVKDIKRVEIEDQNNVKLFAQGTKLSKPLETLLGITDIKKREGINDEGETFIFVEFSELKPLLMQEIGIDGIIVEVEDRILLVNKEGSDLSANETIDEVIEAILYINDEIQRLEMIDQIAKVRNLPYLRKEIQSMIVDLKAERE